MNTHGARVLVLVALVCASLPSAAAAEGPGVEEVPLPPPLVLQRSRRCRPIDRSLDLVIIFGNGRAPTIHGYSLTR